MLLVIVTGPVGSGKSTLLKEVSERLIARRRNVAGFLQPAGQRLEGRRGAESYDLVIIPTGERFTFAQRDETRRPRYQFSEPDIAPFLHQAEIFVIDEFGPLEAAGGGHFRFWPQILAAKPAIVLLSVREDQVEAVSARLAHPIDLVIDLREPQAASRLESLCVDARDWEAVGVYGAGAGAIEATLGSVLHGAKVPLRGNILSALQTILLTSAAEGLARPERVGWSALVAAGLKALSPSGSRLRPMLAISVQGALYAASIRLLGFHPLSVFVGGFLIGAWAGGQGVLLQWLLVGGDLFKAYDVVVHWIANQLGLTAPALPVVLSLCVLASALINGGVALGFWHQRHLGLQRLKATHPFSPSKSDPSQHPLWSSIREMAHPMFWLPIALIVLVLLISGSHWEAALMIGLRSFAVGLVLFSVVRLIRVEAVSRALQKRGLLGPAAAVNRALNRP